MKSNHHPILVGAIFCLMFVMGYSSVFQFEQRARAQEFDQQLSAPQKIARELQKSFPKSQTFHVKIRKAGY